jgi:hypothetical protein
MPRGYQAVAVTAASFSAIFTSIIDGSSKPLRSVEKTQPTGAYLSLQTSHTPHILRITRWWLATMDHNLWTAAIAVRASLAD